MLGSNTNILLASSHYVAFRRPGWLQCELMDSLAQEAAPHLEAKGCLALLERGEVSNPHPQSGDQTSGHHLSHGSSTSITETSDVRPQSQ